MKIVKGHKILLNTTEEVRQKFVAWAGAYRWAYNYGLERKIASYEAEKKSPGAYALASEVVALKKKPETAWLADVPKSVPRTALQHLDAAYGNFFRRVKRGVKKKGFPKFKSRKRSKVVFHLEPDAIAVDGNRVRIPKLGWLKMHQAIRFVGKLVGTVCISLKAGRWFISFNVETEVADPIEKQKRVAVGIDVGVKDLAVLSDGTRFENPKATYRLEKLLARAQRQLTRKRKGSKRRERAKLRVQKIQKRIADLRANSTHHVSAYVAKNYDGVALEDLNVAGMVKNRKLAKAVADANMAELHRQLGYKMGWAGGEVRQVDRWFPSSKLCSVCGCINDELTLADRSWVCDCGVEHDRDLNAAVNIGMKAFGPVVDGPWTLRVSGAVRPPDEASTNFRSADGGSLSDCVQFGTV